MIDLTVLGELLATKAVTMDLTEGVIQVHIRPSVSGVLTMGL